MRNNTFNGLVTAICNRERVYGTQIQSHMTYHGLLSTMIYHFITSGHSDPSIILYTAHSSVKHLNEYHNIQSLKSFEQHFCILISHLKKRPFTKAQLQPLFDEVGVQNHPQWSTLSFFVFRGVPVILRPHLQLKISLLRICIILRISVHREGK